MRRCATDSMTHLHGLAAPYLSVARICAVVKCIPQAAGCLSSPVNRALGGGHREAHKSSGAVTGLTQIAPPCASTILRQTARPIPEPGTSWPVGGRKGRVGPASFVSAAARRAKRRGVEKSRRRVPFPDWPRRPRTPIPSRRKPPPGRLRPDERVRVGPDPLAAVDGLELLHLGGRQREVEDLDVLLEPLDGDGLREHDVAE